MTAVADQTRQDLAFLIAQGTLDGFNRVVFYDGDACMTDCEFRRSPAPRTPEAEPSAEPWYPVGQNDVLPEEFAALLLADPKVRACLLDRHAGLLTAEFWNRNRQRIAAGHIEDVFPHPEALRFRHRYALH
jgi:isocitrate dehydrogenase kinase/phosphatase